MKTQLSPPFLRVCAAALLLVSCLDSRAVPAPLPDQPLAAFQAELLDLAFNAASALPVNPHLKNRSLAQEAVVTASLELEQPRRALDFMAQIGNWRRGACYADYAFYLAQRGLSAEAERYLELARQIADEPAEEAGESWRNDRIRVKIARAYLWLGETQKSAEAVAGTAASESEEMADARASAADEAVFDAQLAALDGIVATLDFDRVRNALVDSAHLFGRFYADEIRRAQAENSIKSSWDSLPVLVRLDLMMMLTDFALLHADFAKGLDLVSEAQLMLNGAGWTPEDEIQLRARLAVLRYRAGDAQRARAEADAALGLFEAERVRIVDIYRAKTLRQIAEAYQAMGDSEAARGVYRLAVGEATVNPNSRPRAMDLAALCTSMAVRGIEPDARLWEELRQARAALGDPW